jgi:hypothetical protein
MQSQDINQSLIDKNQKLCLGDEQEFSIYLPLIINKHPNKIIKESSNH